MESRSRPDRARPLARRTAVRNLVRAGVTGHTVMNLTGHKMRSVFLRDDIVNEADLAEAGRKLAAYREAVADAPPTIVPLEGVRAGAFTFPSQQMRSRRRKA